MKNKILNRQDKEGANDILPKYKKNKKQKQLNTLNIVDKKNIYSIFGQFYN